MNQDQKERLGAIYALYEKYRGKEIRPDIGLFDDIKQLIDSAVLQERAKALLSVHVCECIITDQDRTEHVLEEIRQRIEKGEPT